MKSKAIIIALIFMINACKVEPTLPTVKTLPVSERNDVYFITGGEVVSDGGSPVIARGVCFTVNKQDLPTLDNYKPGFSYTIDSSGIGSFTSKINFVYAGASIMSRREHYYRAYATNSAGTAYGDTISVLPKSRPPSFNSIKLVSLVSTSAILDCGTYIPFAADEFYFCYGPSPSPTIEGTHSIPQQVPNQGGYYKLLNILPSTTYYLRGYYKNESGFAYSPEISFTTYDGELTDIDSNLYPTKTIGNQIWMAENLNVTKYSDGTSIPTIFNDWDWSVTTSGAGIDRYNYYAVIDSRKLCPTGWHVPSDDEWKTLEIYLGMSASDADKYYNRGTNEGGKLKMTSNNAFNKKVWEYPNLGATNSSGFSAEGITWRFDSGQYSTQYYATGFWTSSEFDATNALGRGLSYNSAQIGRGVNSKNTGFSIRCIKD